MVNPFREGSPNPDYQPAPPSDAGAPATVPIAIIVEEQEAMGPEEIAQESPGVDEVMAGAADVPPRRTRSTIDKDATLITEMCERCLAYHGEGNAALHQRSGSGMLTIC
jgi:hypothetical protein